MCSKTRVTGIRSSVFADTARTSVFFSYSSLVQRIYRWRDINNQRSIMTALLMQVEFRPSGRRKRRDEWRDSCPNNFNPRERAPRPLLR